MDLHLARPGLPRHWRQSRLRVRGGRGTRGGRRRPTVVTAVSDEIKSGDRTLAEPAIASPALTAQRVKPPRWNDLTVSGTPAPAWRSIISRMALLGLPNTWMLVVAATVSA